MTLQEDLPSKKAMNQQISSEAASGSRVPGLIARAEGGKAEPSTRMETHVSAAMQQPPSRSSSALDERWAGGERDRRQSPVAGSSHALPEVHTLLSKPTIREHGAEIILEEEAGSPPHPSHDGYLRGAATGQGAEQQRRRVPQAGGSREAAQMAGDARLGQSTNNHPQAGETAAAEETGWSSGRMNVARPYPKELSLSASRDFHFGMDAGGGSSR
jgi:hypothetical protein